MYTVKRESSMSRVALMKKILLGLCLLCLMYVILTINRNTDKSFLHGNREIKVACFILATLHSKNKMAAVNETWAQHCDKYFYLISSPNGSHDVINTNISEGRTYLTDKVVFSFRYMYQHYINDYDWFVKADDDTYMVIENLKFLASHFSGNGPAYIGSHFKHYSPNGYMAGGCGYAINKAALKSLISGFNRSGLCRLTGGAEDLEIGRCLTKVGVPVISSLDKYHKESFQASHVDDYRKRDVPGWIRYYLRNLHKVGEISQYTISYHRLSPDTMRLLHFILYNMQVYKPREDLTNYFKLQVVPPLKDYRNESRFMAYFFENKAQYNDIEKWRKMNNTVLTQNSPKRT